MDAMKAIKTRVLEEDRSHIYDCYGVGKSTLNR